MKTLFILGLLFLAVLISGCTQNQPPGPPAGGANTVTIKSFAFSPAALTVSVGTTVTWTNEDSTTHTVTSDSGSELASEQLSNGQSYTHTFNTAGTYDYHCSIHTTMKGKIIVE